MSDIVIDNNRFNCAGFALDLTPDMRVVFLHQKAPVPSAVPLPKGFMDVFHEIDGHKIIGVEIDRARIGEELRGRVAIGTHTGTGAIINHAHDIILLPLSQALQAALDINALFPLRVSHTICQ